MLNKKRIRGRLRSRRKGTNNTFVIDYWWTLQELYILNFIASSIGIRQFKTFTLATWALMGDVSRTSLN